MTSANEPSTRTQADWIESFLQFTDGIPSPTIFRLWAGIACLAGVMERRIWLPSQGRKLYPNLYILLVAPPGIGKSQAINEVHALWSGVPGLHVAPDSMTRASVFDELEKAGRRIVVSPVEMAEFNSLQISADELGVLISAHDLEFLSLLNKVFDNPTVLNESRRMFQGKNKIIPNPQLNILAGTQPGFMASVLPEEAWSMGFTSRLIMIYSSLPVKVDLFAENVRNDALEKQIQNDLAAIMKLYGKVVMTPEVKEAVTTWYNGGMMPKPEHSKLEHYSTRRYLYLLKLCQIAAVSRSSECIIRLQDYSRALGWLEEAEKAMPDIFRTMAQKSDSMVIQELHHYMWQKYAKDKKPLHESFLFHFLGTKVPSDKMEKILQMATRARIILQDEHRSDLYIPNVKDRIGMSD